MSQEHVEIVRGQIEAFNRGDFSVLLRGRREMGQSDARADT